MIFWVDLLPPEKNNGERSSNFLGGNLDIFQGRASSIGCAIAGRSISENEVFLSLPRGEVAGTWCVLHLRRR